MRKTNAMIAAAVIATSSSVSAVSLDLTTAGSSGTINGAFFTTSTISSTGSGVLDPFVRLSSNDPVEDGYNATARPVMPDVNTSGTFTHDFQISHLPIVVNPVGAAPGSYYEVILDINQNKPDSLLSLDALQIWSRPTALTTADTLGALTAAPSQLRYDLDAGGDSEIILDYNLNSGSGSGDMLAYIPVSALAGVSATDYLYWYSMFGSKPDNGNLTYENNDGFEEWGVRASTVTNVPDGGATAMLLGLGLGGLGLIRRKFNV